MATAGSRFGRALYDPNLPHPWKAVIEVSTKTLMYWNPETNITTTLRPGGTYQSPGTPVSVPPRAQQQLPTHYHQAAPPPFFTAPYYAAPPPTQQQQATHYLQQQQATHYLQQQQATHYLQQQQQQATHYLQQQQQQATHYLQQQQATHYLQQQQAAPPPARQQPTPAPPPYYPTQSQPDDPDDLKKLTIFVRVGGHNPPSAYENFNLPGNEINITISLANTLRSLTEKIKAIAPKEVEMDVNDPDVVFSYAIVYRELRGRNMVVRKIGKIFSTENREEPYEDGYDSSNQTLYALYFGSADLIDVAVLRPDPTP